MRSTRIPAARSGRCPLTRLLPGSITCLCAAVFLALLEVACPGVLRAQPPQSSDTSQPQSHSQTQPPAKAGRQGSSSSASSASSAQPQDQGLGQGDQSLQPDPLDNPVNPPPTPDQPAAADPDASWIAPPSPPPANPPSGSTPEASPGEPLSHSPASGAAALAPAGSAAPAQGAAVASANPPPVPRPAKASDPLRQQINNQCADLLTMANTLQSAVAKTTKDELSVTVVRTAGQIEDLVHKLKDEMRPALSRK